MNFCAKLLLLSIMLFFSVTLMGFSLPLMAKQHGNPIWSVMGATQSQSTVDLESDQSFSGTAGSTVEYNVYVENKGKSISRYTLTASSDKGYYLEVWRDTDQMGSGDLQLIPPQGSTVTMQSGEVVTLIVKVRISVDAASDTVDSTTIRAVSTDSGASDSVTLTTRVDSDLLYPSNWIQLGSDPTFPSPPPVRIDIKAFHYANNGTHVFFKMAEASKPNMNAFLYYVYLDVRSGGQRIEDYYYDYSLRSDGILYEWTGANWANSGYPTYWQTDGTAIVLWIDLATLSIDEQEIHFLASTNTKDGVLKDKLGPYTVMKNNISEIPLLLIPILSLAVLFSVLKMTKKNLRIRGHFQITPADSFHFYLSAKKTF